MRQNDRVFHLLVSNYFDGRFESFLFVIVVPKKKKKTLFFFGSTLNFKFGCNSAKSTLVRTQLMFLNCMATFVHFHQRRGGLES